MLPSPRPGTPLVAIRTRMIGSGPALCAYHLYVPFDALPAARQAQVTHQILDKGRRFVQVVELFLDTGHASLPPGPERWDRYLAAERAAEAFTAATLRQAFPELRGRPPVWLFDETGAETSAEVSLVVPETAPDATAGPLLSAAA